MQLLNAPYGFDKVFLYMWRLILETVQTLAPLSLASSNAPDHISLIKAVHLKILYSRPVDLSILVERSTSNTTSVAVTPNPGVSVDSELKA